VLLPLLSRRVKCMRPGSFIFTVGRCFGGGVVLATGMIHVFPGGIELLANPCLGWPDYPVRLLHASSHGSALATSSALPASPGISYQRPSFPSRHRLICPYGHAVQWGAMIATAAAIVVAIIEFAAGQLLFARMRSRCAKTMPPAHGSMPRA